MIKFFRKTRYDLMEQNKTGKYIKYAIGEIVLVVIGIMIALSINNWKEDLDDEKFISRIFYSIEKEMKSNEVEFNAVMPMQFSLIDTIDQYMNDEKISLSEIIIRGNGLRAPTLNNVSWNYFLNTKLELIDFNTISILTKIEQANQLLNSKISNLMEFVLENSESTNTKSKKMLKFQILNVVSSEKSLLDLHVEYLEKE